MVLPGAIATAAYVSGGFGASSLGSNAGSSGGSVSSANSSQVLAAALVALQLGMGTAAPSSLSLLLEPAFFPEAGQTVLTACLVALITHRRQHAWDKNGSTWLPVTAAGTRLLLPMKHQKSTALQVLEHPNFLLYAPACFAACSEVRSWICKWMCSVVACGRQMNKVLKARSALQSVQPFQPTCFADICLRLAEAIKPHADSCPFILLFCVAHCHASKLGMPCMRVCKAHQLGRTMLQVSWSAAAAAAAAASAWGGARVSQMTRQMSQMVARQKPASRCPS